MSSHSADDGDEKTTAQRNDAPPQGRIPADTFAVRLVLARYLAGRLSIEKAAAQCGLNPGNWAHWEDGRRPRDRVDVAQAVAAGLDVDFNWLLLGGPLAGPRGVPTRPPRDTARYRGLTVRATRGGPIGRPETGGRTGGRRAVRIDLPRAA